MSAFLAFFSVSSLLPSLQEWCSHSISTQQAACSNTLTSCAAMEDYVTDSALSQTTSNVAYSDLTLRCVVLSTVPLRTCEFSDEQVFTAMGSITPMAPGSTASCARPVCINFYGAWGMAAAFMDPGDAVILRGFIRLNAPLTPGRTTGVSSSSGSLPSPVFVSPLSEDEGSELRVLQPGSKGDVMEVLVSPSSMEDICMRGLATTDTSNRLYMQRCLACVST